MSNDHVKLRRIIVLLLAINIILAAILFCIALVLSNPRLTLVQPDALVETVPTATVTATTVPTATVTAVTATNIPPEVSMSAPGAIVAATAVSPPIPPTATPVVEATRIGIEHTVREGEDLWEIAEHYYGSGLAWMTIIDHNPTYDSQTGLEPGDKVFVPRPAGGMPNYITTPVPDAIPIRASAYTLRPIAGLSDEQNVNCNDDCSNLALAAFDPAFYGRAAACPPEWLGTGRTGKLMISGLGEFYCLDAGTLIQFTCREVSGYGDEPICLYEVDFLCESFPPPFHGQLFYEWTIEWVPLDQAIAAAKTGARYCN